MVVKFLGLKHIQVKSNFRIRLAEFYRIAHEVHNNLNESVFIPKKLLEVFLLIGGAIGHLQSYLLLLCKVTQNRKGLFDCVKN